MTEDLLGIDSGATLESTFDRTIKEIKHQFMAFRNGIVADTLRRAGMPYKIIFGLQLPQIAGISRQFAPSMTLAEALWADNNLRESRLLACYLFPREQITFSRAIQLANSVQTQEEADILCFRLLRYLPFAQELMEELKLSPENLIAYCGKALQRNLEAMS